MTCVRFANAMNNAKIITTSNSDNSNIAKTGAQHRQIMKTITHEMLTFKPMVKIPLAQNYAFFTVITFSSINIFT